MDIAAMLVKDLGIVEDDYANIEKLEELRIVDTKLAEKLKNAMDLGIGWFIDITRLTQIALESVEC